MSLREKINKQFNTGLKSQNKTLVSTLRLILAGIKDALEKTPPELSADLVDMGLVLTGGGALLKNVDKLILALKNIL